MRNVACLSILLVLTISSGCRIDPNAEREIALLRSEILDLEDQYYTLKSQCEGGGIVEAGGIIQEDIQYYDAGQNTEYYPQGEFVPGTIVGEGIMLNEPVYGPASGQIYGAADSRFGQHRQLNAGCDCQPQTMNYPQNYQPNVIFSNPVIDTNQPAPAWLAASRTKEQCVPEKRIDDFSGAPQARLPESIVDHDPEFESFQPGTAREPQLSEAEFDDFDLEDYSLDAPHTVEIDVAGISIDRIASGGQDLDGLPGHEGLVLLIQPESLDGEIVQTPGRLAIEVTDPKLRRPRNSIAKWQFSPYEVRNFFVKEQIEEQGILLHLPWDRNAPENRLLLVHVEFTTDDERVFEATREFEIEPPEISYSPEDPIISQWVERDERWKDFPASQPQNYANQFGNRRRSRIPSRPVSSERQLSQPQWRPVR